ncbi:type VI secretion system baseplate subunit TssF [Dinghuibacter silviterrae]|uniref:Uncharacterized protein n=1 Tax=Dinghuibacter silviterrae TaxID=1539049 RepID=A0A4R8DGK9_9BACT|nr:type VI secretion system baseplate subunit TssF [Dinghuibacter silviterrae]TDW96801.1 hypothetical protein EDB95_4637 [Dinghuibacter silviterrae]
MQELRYHSSKEQIRGRLLRHAADFWNLPSATDLDPLVQVLIEGLASELYNVSADMQYTESRLLEKLAGLLTPDLMTMPLPAHALVQARPVENVEILEAGFALRRQTADKGADAWFTPARETPVYNAGIVLLASGNKVTGPSGRPLRAQPGKRLEPYTLWIGLDLPKDIDTLPPLSFYIHSRYEALTEDWYRLLPLSGWKIQGHSLDMRAGLPGDDPDEWLRAFDPLAVRLRDIERYYQAHFLHATPLPLEGGPLPYPPSWKDIFLAADLATLRDPLWWIEVTFPSSIGLQGLEELEVQLNTFPAVNRRLHKIHHRFKGIGHIIPLRPEPGSLFLGVHRLTDSKGRVYEPVPLHPEGGQTPGTYSLRSGGAERFDQRNAREIIDYLFELLRDESAAFSSYGFDFLTQALKSLQQGLTLVEQKARQTLSDITEGTRYIVVKPLDPHETMHLEYWTTQGYLPLQLQSGTPLTQSEGSRLRAGSIRLVTRPVGARTAPGPADRLQAYKYALMTRDRIVTEEDIRLFLRQELGERLGTVVIRKGVMVSQHPKEGLRKTIDVILTDAAFSDDEWPHLSRDLAEKLAARSGIQQYYRILLQ